MEPYLVDLFEAALFAVGVALLVRPRSLANFWFGPRIFDAPKWTALHPLLVRRLRAAFERRRHIVPVWPGYACGVLLIAVALAAITLHFTRAQVFASCAIVVAPILAGALKRAAPRSTRRVASVVPRKPMNVIALLSYVSVAAVCAIGCIIKSPDGLAIAAASIVCAVSSLTLLGSPAMVTGDDLAAEQYVDTLIRNVQVTSINAFGAICGITLSPRTSPDWAMLAMFLAFYLSLITFYGAYRLPSDRERLEMVQ
jgi:hypothetical protein